MPDNHEIGKALEAMLYVWGRPLSIREAAESMDLPVPRVRACMEALMEDYQRRDGGIMIREINGMYQFCTRPECEPYIAKLCTPVVRKRLSTAAMEVLTIVAYRQPVTRAEIDRIRGVKSDRVLDGLTGKGLIEEKGRSDGIGRPVLFGTTDLFLEKFGISGLDELPEIGEFSVS